MLCLSLQPLAVHKDSVLTSRPWNWRSPKFVLDQCHHWRLSVKSLCSEPCSLFGGLNWWLPTRHSCITHAKRKSSKAEVAVKETSSPIKEDVLAGLNEISNEAVKAMARHDSKKIEELKQKVDYLERFLLQEGETDAAKFMLIIAGMLDHMVPAESDELNDSYKAALKKMCNVVEDLGWILKFENEEKVQEMVDDDLIPPVLNGPY